MDKILIDGEITDIVNLSEEDMERLNNETTRSGLITDLREIIELFNRLRNNYNLSKTDHSTVEIMVETLSQLHNDVARGAVKSGRYPFVRKAIKSAYQIYPSVSSNYSQEAVKAKQIATEEIFRVRWKTVFVGLILICIIAFLSGCDQKKEDDVEFYTVGQLIKFDCVSNGTGFTVQESVSYGRSMVPRDVWYYPYTCSNGKHYSKILIKPIKVQ